MITIIIYDDYHYTPWIYNESEDDKSRSTEDCIQTSKNSRYFFYHEEVFQKNANLAKAWDAKANHDNEQILVYVMVDLFPDASGLEMLEAHEIVKARMALFSLIRATPHLTWRISTKNPKEALKSFPLGPWRNVWFGINIYDEKDSEQVSYLSQFRDSFPVTYIDMRNYCDTIDFQYSFVDWVTITGGLNPFEPTEIAVARIASLLVFCAKHGIPCWYMGHSAKFIRDLLVRQSDDAYSKFANSRLWQVHELPVERWVKPPPGPKLSNPKKR